MKPLRLALVLVLAALPWLLPACSSCGEKPAGPVAPPPAENTAGKPAAGDAAPAADAAADPNAGQPGQAAATTPPESAPQAVPFGAANELPANFPADLPIYDGAKPTIAVAQSEKGVFVTLNAPGTVEQVKAFYKDRMKAAGWSVDSEMTIQESVVLGCKKGNRTAMVNVSPGSKDTGGSVIVLSSETVDAN